MNHTHRFMFSIAIFLAVLASTLNFIPVLADDSAPPPPPAEDSAPVSEDIDPVVADLTTVAATVPGDESPAAVSLPDVLEQLPEGTQVIVQNAQGETIPLATQEAAEVISESDPEWCPTGVIPGSASCSGVKTSFNNASPLLGLVAWLTANPQTKAGTIWIQNTYVGTSGLEGASVTLNGALLGTTANYALTLNGGWTGSGSGISGKSTFNVPLLIIGWNANLTLNNIIVSGASVINAAVDNEALKLDTTGSVVLKNSTVENGVNPNASYVMNGAVIVNDGSVTITNSDFNGNEGNGLQITSGGKITATNLIALGNDREGVRLDNSSATTAQAVTLTGAQQINGNGSNGLVIISNGAVTISKLTASSNGILSGGYGANIINTNGASLSIPVYAPVTISGVNQFSSNNGTGLSVLSNGAITIAQVTASSNSTTGISLNNSTAVTPQKVTLTGYVITENNTSGGANISSHGVITIAGITATNNGSYGFTIHNDFVAASPVDVILTGTNLFDKNSGNGLTLYSYGAITISNLAAGSNIGSGAYLYNAGGTVAKAVTLTGTVQANNNSAGNGLSIFSRGVVTLPGTAAANNAGYGVSIQNNYDLTNPVDVKLAGTNTFNKNGSSGLNVQSYGAITVNNLNVNNNSASGANLDNFGGSTAHLHKPVTITGYLQTNTNGGLGISVYSLGVVSLNNITATNNIGGGAAIYNNYDTAGPAAVTLTGINLFDKNGGAGLTVQSYGAVTVSSLTASNNSGNGTAITTRGVVTMSGVNAANNVGYGLTIANNFVAASPVDVKLNGTNLFDKNGNNGLYIYSYGAITVSNLTTTNNIGSGAYLANNGGTVSKPVTLTGTVQANNNSAGSGLSISSLGVVTLPGVTAANNGSYGVSIYNNYDLANPVDVKLAGTNTFNKNGAAGLNVQSYGAITVNNLNVNNNASTGAYLDNFGGSTAHLHKLVTITGYLQANTNAGLGLSISSLGVVSLNNITATNNLGDGVAVYNTYDPAVPGEVKLSGTNLFDKNGGNGLTIYSYGAITVSNLTVTNNGSGGASLSNNSGTAVKPVTLTGTVQANNNSAGSGLSINSRGVVTLPGTTAANNSGYGVSINNNYDPANPVDVILAGINTFSKNGSSGLNVQSFGAITVSNLNVNNNGGTGANLDNYGGSSAHLHKPLTISGTIQANTNVGLGLSIYSLGAVSLNNITATNNAGGGVSVYNNYDTANPAAVQLSGINLFDKNGSVGLSVQSYGAVTVSTLTASNNTGSGTDISTRGVVTITGVNAANNSGYGLSIHNDFVVLNPVDVKLNGINLFDKNGSTGLYVYSFGAITVSSLTATNNGSGGVYLYNAGVTIPKPVTLTGTVVQANNNAAGSGLTIYSRGVVTLPGIAAANNASYGASIYNNFDTANPLAVTLMGTNTFNKNGSSGLSIQSYGAVTVSGLTAGSNIGSGTDISTRGVVTISGVNATNNGGYGLAIHNDFVSITPVDVKLSGINLFDKNGSTGLTIYSYGAITVSSLTATNNGSGGAYLYNAGGTISKAVTLSGIVQANNNAVGSGLSIYSRGVVTLPAVTASNNASYGTFVQNNYNSAQQFNVTITGASRFNENASTGLYVISYGTVTLASLEANNNTGQGVSLQNDGGTLARQITLNGTDIFNSNSGDGLRFVSDGAVVINHVTANNNGANGLNGTTDGNITVKVCAFVSANASKGVTLSSSAGIVTLKGFYSAANGLADTISVPNVITKKFCQ